MSDDDELEVDFVDHEELDRASGKAAFLEACAARGVAPMPAFLESLQREECALSNRGLTGPEAEAMAAALRENRSIESVDLSGNPHIGVAGLGALCDAIRVNDAVSAVDLSHTHAEQRFGAPQRAGEALARLLAGNDDLLELRAASLALGLAGARALQPGLLQNSALYVLDLSRNALPAAAGALVAEVVERTYSLQRLTLAWNELRDEGGGAVLRAVATNGSLVAVDLAFCGIGDAVAAAVGEVLARNIRLAELALPHNRLGAVAAEAIAVGLEQNQTLTSLDLDQNALGHDGAEAVLAAAAGTETLVKLGLANATLAPESLSGASVAVVSSREGGEVRLRYP